MTIHIYSDSFGEDYCEKGHWPFELAKLQQQNIVGNGTGGTGPNWSLRKLIRDLEENKFDRHDSVIVLLSDQKRMEFPWLDHEQLADGIFLLAENIDRKSELSTNLQNNKIRYKKHEPEIKTVANTLGPMFLYENVKNITFLHLLSKNFKKFKFLVFSTIKFLVFTCFSLDHYTSKYKNFNIESTKLLHDLDFDYLNTSNFYYVPTPISYMVGKYNGEEQIVLHNHMTPDQNKKFALLCNDILKGDAPDTSWFVYTPYDDPFAEHQGTEPPPPIFIYE